MNTYQIAGLVVAGVGCVSLLGMFFQPTIERMVAAGIFSCIVIALGLITSADWG